VGAVGAQSTTPTESSGASFLKQVAASA